MILFHEPKYVKKKNIIFWYHSGKFTRRLLVWVVFRQTKVSLKFPESGILQREEFGIFGDTKYMPEFKHSIKSEEFIPSTVFNYVETSLFCKKISKWIIVVYKRIIHCQDINL